MWVKVDATSRTLQALDTAPDQAKFPTCFIARPGVASTRVINADVDCRPMPALNKSDSRTSDRR
jgi:hypothetical protein